MGATTPATASRIEAASINRHRQGYNAVQIDTIKQHTVRYVMHVDAYCSSQSSCRIEVFSPAALRWNEVWALDPADTAGMPRWAGRDEDGFGAPANIVFALDRLADRLNYFASRVLP